MPDDPVACRLLGVMKLQGIGLARDVDRGRQMLVRACDAKDDEACRVLKTLTENANGAANEAEDAGVAGDGGGATDAHAPRTTPE